MTPIPEMPYERMSALARRSVRMLRFPPALERRFQELHLRRSRRRVRVWQTFLFLLVVFYGVYRAHLAGAHASPAEMVIRFGVLAPVLALLVAVVWKADYEVRFPVLSPTLVFLGSCGYAVLMAIVVNAGRGEALSGLTTALLGAFFGSGLVFRRALALTIAMLLTFIVAGLFLGTALPKLMFDAISPLATFGLGAFVYYDMERASRIAFLEQAEVAQKALSDPLTGLRNRRAFDEHLTRMWPELTRRASSFGLLLIDVDHFKRYNDRYGHQAGDRCLQRIAELVQQSAPHPQSLAARLGGEEFAVLLPDVGARELAQFAERLRASVQGLGMEHRASPDGSVVTVSIGAALIDPAPDRSHEGLVQLGDEALYQAKREGRNRVVMKAGDYDGLHTGVFRNPGEVAGR